MKDLAKLALDTASGLGAQYADIRIISYHNQNIGTEDERVGINDSESLGFGVRVIKNGAWGFAGNSKVNKDQIQQTAQLAVQIADASSIVMDKPVSLVPEPAHIDEFVSPHEIDPFEVAIDEKVGLLLEINRRLLSHSEIKKAYGHMTFRKADRLFANTDGSMLKSLVITSGVQYQATAVGKNDAKTRSYEPPPMTRGYEIIDADNLLENTERVADQAVEKLHADKGPVGKKDLILDPLHLALTMHESVGHPTELDRALGMEESLAGRSFATPDLLNNLQYGSPIVNFVGWNSLEGGLATHGFDDDGVTGQKWHIVKDGIFVGYSTNREVAGEIGLDRSYGSCRADNWGSIPIVRIPNLCLEAGKKPLTLDELISDTKDGIYIEGMGSFSIDQMRYNFQFGGDAFWEIKNGKITKMLKNVTYQSITTDFWNSCDAICDERFWVPNGVMNCGKGDPGQVSQMTHGAAPSRFRQINVGIG